jgi:hypothetical protein
MNINRITTVVAILFAVGAAGVILFGLTFIPEDNTQPTVEQGTLVKLSAPAESGRTLVETTRGFFTVIGHMSGKKDGRCYCKNGYLYVEQYDGSMRKCYISN